MRICVSVSVSQSFFQILVIFPEQIIFVTDEIEDFVKVLILGILRPHFQMIIVSLIGKHSVEICQLKVELLDQDESKLVIRRRILVDYLLGKTGKENICVSLMEDSCVVVLEGLDSSLSRSFLSLEFSVIFQLNCLFGS